MAFSADGIEKVTDRNRNVDTASHCRQIPSSYVSKSSVHKHA